MPIYRGDGGSGDATTDAYASQVALDAQTATNKANEASNSATAAASSATNAATSATNAATSETNAATSETNAATSETNAASSATSAASSASAASTSETNAGTSETNAATSATNAASSATTATTQASAASTSATNAATSASNASTSATNAATSATSASTAQTAAETAQTAAETAQAAAEAAQTAIDGFFLGALSSTPTVDGNGNPVTAGDWYFDTTDNQTYIYDGSSWQSINPDLVGDSSPQLGGNLDLNSNDITGTGNINITGNVSLSGTVDGRDVATDGTKLDGIEASADVTDTANVTAAGALMDSEVTNLAQVKSFDSSDYATAAQGALADSALQGNETITLSGAITGSGTTSITTTLSSIDGGTY